MVQQRLQPGGIACQALGSPLNPAPARLSQGPAVPHHDQCAPRQHRRKVPEPAATPGTMPAGPDSAPGAGGVDGFVDVKLADVVGEQAGQLARLGIVGTVDTPVLDGDSVDSIAPCNGLGYV